jgi:regulator of sigma E protease
MEILKFIGIIFEVLIIFNLLIVVHELGHFLAAKWRGLYIERFGIWFGKPIWEKKIRGVWYSLGCIPAGGFVKLPQLAPMESLEGETEIPKEQLKPITPLDKIIVAFAGPLFSFLLAVVMAIIVWQIGRPVGEADFTTTIGYVQDGSPAEAAKLQNGDVIKTIDGREVKRWGGQNDDGVTWRIVRSESSTLKMEVERNGQLVPIEVKPRVEETKWYERRALRQIGIGPKNRPSVWEAAKDSPAEKAGFQRGDRIVGVGDQNVYSEASLFFWAKENPNEPLKVTVERGEKRADGTIPTTVLTFEPMGVKVNAIVKDSPASRAGLKVDDVILATNGLPVRFAENFASRVWEHNEKPMEVTVRRGKEEIKLTVVPEIPISGTDKQNPKPSIGIGMTAIDGLVYSPFSKMEPIYPHPSEQIRDAVMAMVNTLDAVTSSKSNISIQHMGGPVMMMRIYYLLFKNPEGWKLALWFSVILNMNLALLNMLPLPVLDGGHITLAVIEGISRRPVNAKLLEWVQTACALLLMGFMVFVTFFDVQDLFGGEKKNEMRFKQQPAPAQGS